MELGSLYQIGYTIFFVIMSLIFGLGGFDALKKQSTIRAVGNFTAMSFCVFVCLVRFGIIAKI